MITYKMHFIRTGSASAGPRRYVGQLDLPLGDVGRAELEALQDQLEYPWVQMVFASPLRRCVQTAEALYPEQYVEIVEDLADMNLGDFQGQTLEELQGDPAFDAWLQNSTANPPPGGEETADFTLRIVTAVQGIFNRMMEEKLSSVAVVTHGGVIMSLLAGIGLPKRPMHDWAVGNGTGYTLLFTPQMWMRDRCAEIFAPIPTLPERDEEDIYRLYDNNNEKE